MIIKIPKSLPISLLYFPVGHSIPFSEIDFCQSAASEDRSAGGLLNGLSGLLRPLQRGTVNFVQKNSLEPLSKALSLPESLWGKLIINQPLKTGGNVQTCRIKYSFKRVSFLSGISRNDKNARIQTAGKESRYRMGAS